MNEEANKNKYLEIQSFFGAFEDESEDWEDIEMRLYSARNKFRNREIPILDT